MSWKTAAPHAPRIGERFGARVLTLVEGCTDGLAGAKAPWRERKAAYIAHLAHAPEDLLLVSACDKLHNARAIGADLVQVGEAVFDRFNAGRAGTLWYYGALAEVFGRRLPGHAASAALCREVAAISGSPGS